MCCGSAKQDAIGKCNCTRPYTMHTCMPYNIHIIDGVIIGYVNGGDVVRMIHRHSGVDCLTVAMKSSDSRSVGSNPSGDEDEV